MSSEIARKNRDNSAELAELQKQYQKKRKELIGNQEEDLSALKENYQKQKANHKPGNKV